MDTEDFFEFINEDEDLHYALGDEAAFDAENVIPEDSSHLFVGHRDAVFTLACGTFGEAATGGADRTTFMWYINDKYEPYEFAEQRGFVSALSFSSKGRFLASGDSAGDIYIYDLELDVCAYRKDMHKIVSSIGGGIKWLSWHPREYKLLGGMEDCCARIWSINENCYGDLQPDNIFSGHLQPVTCGGFTPDGNTVCTGSSDASLRIWNVENGQNVHTIGQGYYTEGLTCLSISSDSAYVLSGSMDGSAVIVNITTGKVLSSLDSHKDPIKCIGFSPEDPSLAATGGMDGKLCIWNMKSLSSPKSTCYHEDGVTCLAWPLDGSCIATGCLDGKVRVWDSEDGVLVRTYEGHSKAVESLAVSHDGRSVVSVSRDNTARVFSVDM